MHGEKERESGRERNPFWNTHTPENLFRHLTPLFPQNPRELGFTALQICQGEKMQGCANSKAKQLETLTMGQTSVRASW